LIISNNLITAQSTKFICNCR